MADDVPRYLTGRYFPAGTSASLEGKLENRNSRLVFIQPSSAEELPVEFRELGDRLADLPRKIYFQDGSVFECADNDAVDLAFATTGQFSSHLTKAEGSLKFVVIAVIATVVVLAGLFRYGLPAAASFAAWATPTSAVALIDQGALDTVDRVFFNPSEMSDENQQKYSSIFDELVEASGRDDLPLQLLFRDGGRLGANAVALPGGTIILTDQLAELAESDDEVAGVLAHEIGHVVDQHSLRQIYRAAGIAFMAAVVIGDSSQLVDNVVGQAALLDTSSYSRQFETDADAYSVDLMLKTGRDPVAFVDLIDRIFEDAGIDGKDTGWLDTHPGNEDRREQVLREVERQKD